MMDTITLIFLLAVFLPIFLGAYNLFLSGFEIIDDNSYYKLNGCCMSISLISFVLLSLFQFGCYIGKQSAHMEIKEQAEKEKAENEVIMGERVRT